MNLPINKKNYSNFLIFLMLSLILLNYNCILLYKLKNIKIQEK